MKRPESEVDSMFWPNALTEPSFALVIDPSHSRFGELAEVARQSEGTLYLKFTPAGPLDPEEGVSNARVFLRKPTDETAALLKEALEEIRPELADLFLIASGLSDPDLLLTVQESVMKLVEDIVLRITAPLEESSCS